MKTAKSKRRKYWLDEPRNVTRLFHGLVALCALLFAADLFYAKHAEIAVGAWLGFDGIFSFASCVFLVLAAKRLRQLVRRNENYYD